MSAELTLKIKYSDRITCRAVIGMVRAVLPESCEVSPVKAVFGTDQGPSREYVAEELAALAEQMDIVARDMDQLALVHGVEQEDHEAGGSWAILSHSIELHGAAGMARSWAAEIGSAER